VSEGSRTFPKRKFYQARVVPVSWQSSVRKSSIAQPAGDGAFSDFYPADYAAAHFERANKIGIM